MKKCIYARCRREIPDEALFCQWCGRKQVKDTRKRSRREKGSGSVYKLPGQRRRAWYATLNGKSLGRTYATRAEAEQALEAAVRTRHPELYQYTLEDVYQAWSEVAFRDLSESSRHGYQLSWKYVPEELRRSYGRDLRPDAIQKIVDDQQAMGKSDSTAKHIRNLFSALCTWMMQRDLITQNYASYVTVRKTEHRPVVVFTPEEVSRIYALAETQPVGVPEEAAMLTMIYLFTGLRISELFLLRVSDLHLEAEVPYFQGGVKTEAGRNRVVPIYHRILPYFRRLRDKATGELLISGYSGRKTPDGWRANDYKRMLEQLGISYRVPHNTRKTMATNAAQSGVDQIALQKLMGWEDIGVGTKYYIEPNVAYLAQEMDKLGGWGTVR